MVVLKAVGAAEFSDDKTTFCAKYRLREKAVTEVRKLRLQLTNAGMSPNKYSYIFEILIRLFEMKYF